MLLPVDALNIKLTAILGATCGHEDIKREKFCQTARSCHLTLSKETVLARFHA